jgi:hypothetical protein
MLATMRRRFIALVPLAPLLFGGCGASESRPTPPAPAAPPSATTPVRPVASPASSPVPAASSAAPAPEPPDPFEGTVFPPRDFEPPHAVSAKQGDGHWVRLGSADSGDRAAQDPAVMVRTVVHPHPISKFIDVTIAAIDLKHVALHLVAGTDDPDVGKLGPDYHVGLVAPGDLRNVLAVFNGGFMPQHGGWGMMVEGQTLVSPRDIGCTVGLLQDGSVRIGSWTALSGTPMRSYRQTPPCLLERGAVHPDLQAGKDRPWAGKNPKLVTRRRSSIGLDASGRTLFFGMGEEADPKLLAEALKAAGATDAAQLDINWTWTRFLLLGQPRAGAPLQVTSTLIPKMVHRKRGYVEETQPRDFFYLARRGDTSR